MTLDYLSRGAAAQRTPPTEDEDLVPASNLLVVDDSGAMLLQHGRDTGQ
jgi:hypothetical protein